MTMRPWHVDPDVAADTTILSASMGGVAATHSSMSEFLSCLATHRLLYLDPLSMSIHRALSGPRPVFFQHSSNDTLS